jgi:hypothetical protein
LSFGFPVPFLCRETTRRRRRVDGRHPHAQTAAPAGSFRILGIIYARASCIFIFC